MGGHGASERGLGLLVVRGEEVLPLGALGGGLGGGGGGGVVLLWRVRRVVGLWEGWACLPC